MSNRGIRFAAGALGIVALSLCSCGFFEPRPSDQSAAVEPADETTAQEPVAETAAQRALNSLFARTVYNGFQAAGSSSRHRPVQYAALEPAEGSATEGVPGPAVTRDVNQAFQSVATPKGNQTLHLTVTKAAPVRSLLEMRHHDVIIQSWDLSCGAAALATLPRYEWGYSVTEKKVAQGLMARKEYIQHPNLVQVREGFSLLDLKRYVETHGFKGEGLGNSTSTIWSKMRRSWSRSMRSATIIS